MFERMTFESNGNGIYCFLKLQPKLNLALYGSRENELNLALYGSRENELNLALYGSRENELNLALYGSRENELNLALYGSRDRVPGMKHEEVARRRGSVMPSLNKRLNIAKLEKQPARYEARGRPSPPRLKSAHYSLTTKIVSILTILAFHVSFVIPFALFSLLSSVISPLNAQSVPTLGSTKQFANDELKPYVDAAKAGATDSGSFLNTVTNGEQVLEAAWETSVNAEIEGIVGGVNNSDAVNNVNVYKDAVRAQLELQKQQAKSQWIADVNAYIQAELQIFLATLSQNTSNNVTSTNTNSVQTINPTVQNVTTNPVP
ncbi:hypothetical protein LEP1GSC188_0548, partial [Leptospira weilii serovar Topaz str. LT2116]